MVQFVNLPQSARGRLSDILGQEIGGGLANFTGNYFANKALDKVLNDPELQKADLSERQSRLQQSLQPYGQYGENIFQKRLQVEQQREQEQEGKRSERLNRARNKAENKFISGQQLSPEEEELIRPELMVSYLKATQPKAPLGGLSGQAVPQEISQAIPNILNQNKDASSDELATAFDQAGIPRAYSNSYIENRRRQDESKAKSVPQAFKETREERKKLLEQGKAYQETKMRLDRMEELNKEGDLSTPGMITVLEKTGLPIGLLGNPSSEEFDKLSQDLFKDIQSTFGNRILKVEVDNFAKTIPTLKNSKEGRQRIINNMRLLSEGKKIAYDAYKDIMKGRESPPLDLMEKVDERASEKLDDLSERFKQVNESERQIPVGKIKVKSPNGKEGTIPKENIEKARKQGYVIFE